MIPYLAPLKSSVWLRITSIAFACGVVGICIWALSDKLLPIGPVFSALLAGIITLLLAILLGNLVTLYAIKSTDFLARAILLVTNKDIRVDAPNPDTLSASSEFLAKLAQNVYELTSNDATVKTDEDNKLIFFSTLADNMPLPAVVLSKDRQICFANDAAIHYLEREPKEITGKPFYDVINLSFVSDMTLESWLNDCAQNAVTETEVWERVRLNLPDDRRKQFDLAAHYSNNDSNGLETILVMIDRTLQYERDDHDLTFVALAVHELRTPLTIMRGYVEVFEDELSPNLNNEQTTFMHNMGASAQQLTSFVSNILNVARVEENSLYLNLKEETWKDVLLTACKDMELRAKVRNKRLVYDIAENLPTVAVDKVSIYEVVANLIDNAIKYTHTDEEIVIKTYEKDGMVETTVTDKGVGIPESTIEHVFDKFYRAHHSKNSVGGSGLGLYLSRAIITAHGGSIWVNSKEDEGSTFGFSLPIYASVADQIKSEDNGSIVRGAHGWIKNHSLYRE